MNRYQISKYALIIVAITRFGMANAQISYESPSCIPRPTENPFCEFKNIHTNTSVFYDEIDVQNTVDVNTDGVFPKFSPEDKALYAAGLLSSYTGRNGAIENLHDATKLRNIIGRMLTRQYHSKLHKGADKTTMDKWRSEGREMAHTLVSQIYGHPISWEDFNAGHGPTFPDATADNISGTWHRKMKEAAEKLAPSLPLGGTFGYYMRGSFNQDFVAGTPATPVPASAGIYFSVPMYSCVAGRACISIVEQIKQQNKFTMSVAVRGGTHKELFKLLATSFEGDFALQVNLDIDTLGKGVRVNSVQLELDADGVAKVSGQDILNYGTKTYAKYLNANSIPHVPLDPLPFYPPDTLMDAAYLQSVIYKNSEAILGKTATSFGAKFVGQQIVPYALAEGALTVTAMNPNFVSQHNNPQTTAWRAGWSNPKNTQLSFGTQMLGQAGNRLQVQLGPVGYKSTLDLRLYMQVTGALNVALTQASKNAANSGAGQLPIYLLNPN